jgi:hypothetical protein
MYRGAREGVIVNPSGQSARGVPSAPPVELVDLFRIYLVGGGVRRAPALAGHVPLARQVGSDLATYRFVRTAQLTL